jgi:hypothetical protein
MVWDRYSPGITVIIFKFLCSVNILLVPNGYHSKEVGKKKRGHIENKLTGPKRKVPPPSRELFMPSTTVSSPIQWEIRPRSFRGKGNEPKSSEVTIFRE